MLGYTYTVGGLLAAMPLLVMLAGCGGNTIDLQPLAWQPGGGGDGEQPSPSTGEQTVFSDIDVEVLLNGYDSVDYNARDDSGDFLDEAPVTVSLSARVIINGGTSEGRVEGLQVLGDGTALEEVGSAAFPQTFSFTHAPSPAVHGQAVDLQFQYQGSTSSIRLEAPLVEITRPSAGEVLSADEVLKLTWTGADAAPEQAGVTQVGRTPACVISYRPSGATTFVPERGSAGQEPPCQFEVSADWLVDTSMPSSPFRSLRVERAARRIQRFSID